jgi:hypothetical protein
MRSHSKYFLFQVAKLISWAMLGIDIGIGSVNTALFYTWSLTTIQTQRNTSAHFR